jgi:hypothetical protein
MSVVVRGILGVVLGLTIGSAVNMGLIVVGPMLVPPPDGADMTTMEGLKAAMVLLEPKHFVFPFLAHALGTLGGALVAMGIGRAAAPCHGRRARASGTSRSACPTSATSR